MVGKDCYYIEYGWKQYERLSNLCMMFEFSKKNSYICIS